MAIGFIGAGKMAEGIISAIKNKKSLLVGARREERGLELERRYGVRTTRSNAEVVSKSQIVFLCVEPKSVPEVAAEISPLLHEGQTLVSIVAGRSIKSLKGLIGSKAGMQELMKPAFKEAVFKTVRACAKRAAELGQD